MKTILIGLYLLFLVFSVRAQKGIVNNGAFLVINPGAKVYIDGNADGNLTLGPVATFILDGWLTLEGEVFNSGTIILEPNASLIDNGLPTGSGATILKKSIEQSNIYFFSAPINGLTAGDFTNCFLEKYNESTPSWDTLNAGQDLINMMGYNLSTSLSEATLELSGNMNTGEYSLALSSSVDGWNLVGNPYPSGIDWNEIVLLNSNIDNALYAWNGYNYSYYLANSGLSLNGGTSFIEPASSFFIKANAAVPLEFSNEIRLHESENPASSPDYLGDYLKITVNHNTYSDETLINFISGANSNFDTEYDACKLFSRIPEVPQIYTKSDGIAYAINSLPLSETTVVVPLSFKSGVDGTYTLKFNDYNFENIVNIYIEDHYITEQLEAIYINNDTLRSSFEFDYSTSDSPDRFTLYFNYTATDISTNLNINLWNVYSINKTVYVNLNIIGIEYTTIKIYNILGELVYQDQAFMGLNSFYLNQCLPGIYFVNTVINEKVFSEKILLH